MKANEFMSKIDKKEIVFKSEFASGTFGWEFDFAEAYSAYQNKDLLQANSQRQLKIEQLQDQIKQIKK